MAVSWVEGDTVVSVPTIQGRLHFVWGDGGHNGPRRLSVVSLTGSVFVESGVVNNSPRAAVKLGSNDHSAAPGHRVIDRDLLKDAQADVTVQALLDLVLPVEGHLAGCVDSHRTVLLVSEDAERRRVLHEAERPMLSTIKGTVFKPVHDVLF